MDYLFCNCFVMYVLKVFIISLITIYLDKYIGNTVLKVSLIITEEIETEK